MRISVLTPSYNYARYLPDTLESVARQEGVDVEHVVVDDGSTDDSAHILAEWADRIVLEKKPNAGLSHTLNRALELATGDAIGWLNADDFYFPGALATVADVFRRRPDVDVVFGDSVFIDPAARVLRFAPQHDMSRSVLRWYGSFMAPCATFRRRGAVPSRGWDEGMRWLMDWDQDLESIEAGRRYAHVPQAIGAFRRHDEQQSALTFDSDASEIATVVERYGLPAVGLQRRAASVLGHLLHGNRKAHAGAYQRQLRARQFRGQDSRWWLSPEALETVERIMSL